MKINSRGIALWAIYGAFAAYAFNAYWHDTIFRFSVPLGGVKALVWVALAGFLVYSLYCTSREDIFRTIGTMSKLHWGRQIGIDLYLGLFIATFIIYLHEGTVAVLTWLVPTILFANLSVLLYIALNFDSLVARFLGS